MKVGQRYKPPVMNEYRGVVYSTVNIINTTLRYV